ncbi:MAG: putative membrane protein, partial [Candidatus Saccharimonadales bacterium]
MAKSKKTKLSIKQRAISLFTQKLSHVGMSFGVYFMVLSLTPSLMPRTWLFQGLVSGLSLISGYAFGTGLMWIWRFLHVRELNGDVKLYVSRAVHIFNALLFLYIMAKVGDWQNRVRELVGVEPSSTTNPFRIVFIAVVTASILLILARIIRVSTSKVIRFTERYVPRRVATIVGILIAFWFFGTVVSGAFQSTALRLANNTFSLADRSTKDGSFVPSSSLRSAGPESIVQWDDLGKQGREFVGRGPTADDISAVADGAIDPIRVYAGLANGETHEERSAVVLQELIRTNAFDRSKMVIATSTGTGYLDP